MKQKRSYRRRGSPDLLISVYFCDSSSILYNPIPEYHPETEFVRVEKGYLIVETINEAINLGKKISFEYFKYNVKKEKKLNW